jgi:hypothetical protein
MNVNLEIKILLTRDFLCFFRLPEIPMMSKLFCISELLPSLYLCGANALRPGKLEELNISLVVNCTLELPDTPLPNREIIYFRVAVKDSKDSDLQQYFHEVADLIEMVGPRIHNARMESF